MSTFSSKRVPLLLLAFLCFAIPTELCFSNSGLRITSYSSAFRVIFKRKLIENRSAPPVDVLVIGDSRAGAIDVRQLEEKFPEGTVLYNLAIEDMGTSLQYYLTLKKWLSYRNTPTHIVFAPSPETFVTPVCDGIFDHESPIAEVIEGDMHLFRRLFSFSEFIREVPLSCTRSLFRAYFQNLLPSIDYRHFARMFYFTEDREEHLSSVEELRSELVDMKGGFLLFRGQQFPADGVVPKPFWERVRREVENPFSSSANIERLMELAHENEISVFVVIPPMLREIHSDHVEYRTMAWVERTLQKWKEKYPKFHYLDYKYVYQRKYFSDWTHLTDEGAEQFNKDIVQALEKIKIEAPESLTTK